jgi:DNA repair exonuclease SbcCD ATPase subunit
MATAKQLLKEIDQLVGELTATAERLRTVSDRAIEEAEISSLQDQQNEIIQRLSQADEALKAVDSNYQKLPAWEAIQKRLEHFTDLNREFVKNLSVRKGVLNFELQDIRKTRRYLRGMDESYGKTKPTRPRLDKKQ